MEFSEDLLVRHCAPTLAGLKTGSIFSCTFAGQHAMTDCLRRLNRTLGQKGLRVLPLRRRQNRVLIYVFRPARLCRDLTDHAACQLLHDRGYRSLNAAACIAHLTRRLAENAEFPHEIGLFLGYPPEDVRGFIESRAEHFKCAGCWKVYGDDAAAQKQFIQYKKCTHVYCREFARGCPLERLTLPVRH